MIPGGDLSEAGIAYLEISGGHPPSRTDLLAPEIRHADRLFAFLKTAGLDAYAASSSTHFFSCFETR